MTEVKKTTSESQIYRVKPGKPFEAVQFKGTERSAKAIVEFAKQHGGAAWRRPAQVPLYDSEKRTAIAGCTDAMAWQETTDDKARRSDSIQWIEIGMWITTLNNDYDASVRLIEDSYFQTEFESFE